MNLKRIIKEEIDDSLDWIKDTPEVSIGGKNGLPIESVPLGTKIVTPDGDVFTIEDVTGFHMPHQFVWGRDLKPAWLGPKNDEDNKNWHNALWLRRATPEDLNESEELDWIKGVDTYYKVEQLEVGKMYEFIPDYSIMGKYDGYDDFPNWVSSYEGQNFYIIKQEPKPRFPKSGEITFKQIGKSNKMIYDGKYVKLPYNARVFLWGKFKEVENPEFVTENEELDWIQDTQPDKKDILNFNKKMYKTTLDYDDIKIGDKFIPPGSHHIWTVDDMYDWGVSRRDYRFMVWLKNDKGSIRRKIYNRGNKFPGDYRPWRKIVNEQIKESNKEWDWAKDITPVELEDPEDWIGRSFGYGPEIIDEMSDMEIIEGDHEEYYTIKEIDVNGNLSLTKYHPKYGKNHDSSTSVNFLREYISNGRWVWK